VISSAGTTLTGLDRGMELPCVLLVLHWAEIVAAPIIEQCCVWWLQLVMVQVCLGGQSCDGDICTPWVCSLHAFG
jgi:hypothetical protein